MVDNRIGSVLATDPWTNKCINCEDVVIQVLPVDVSFLVLILVTVFHDS